MADTKISDLSDGGTVQTSDAIPVARGAANYKVVVGSAATQSTGAFATAAQGALADSATQPSDNISTLTNDSGYITASSTDTLANKSGNISQWTNDAGYVTSQGDAFTTIAVSGQTDVVADSSTDTLTLAAGSNVTITTNATTDTITIAATGGGTLGDGDYGDITVSSSGTVMTIDADTVTYDKMQDTSATDVILGRSTAGAGTVEEIACTAAGRALIDDADASAQRTTLGLAIGTDVQAHSAVLDATTASFTTADETKLDGIEASADVTDEANVTSALDGATLTDVGTPASGDLILLQDASDSNNLKVAQFSTFGGGGGGSSTLSGLTDTTITSPANGDILEHDGTDWKNNTTLKAGANTLADRLSVISNFASPNAGGFVSGNYYDGCMNGSTGSTLTASGDRIEMIPYYTSEELTIDQIGIQTTVAGGSGVSVKIVIYQSGSDGWPDAIVYESAEIAVDGATGFQSIAASFTFAAGVGYWVGCWYESGVGTFRGISKDSLRSLGPSGSAANTQYTMIRRTGLTYNPSSGTAPDPWTFTSSDLVANFIPPCVRFRKA